MSGIWNAFSQQMKPKFHEISAYLIACSFCWLLVFHADLRRGYFAFFSGLGSMSPYFLMLGVIFTGGLSLSLYNVFTKHKKSALERGVMGWFIMGVSGVASFFVGAEMLSSRSPLAMVLVAWNILMSAVMLIQMGMRDYDISEEDASIAEVLVTTVILAGILIYADFVLRLSWAVILSIGIFYSTTIVFITIWIGDYFELQLPGFLK